MHGSMRLAHRGANAHPCAHGRMSVGDPGIGCSGAPRGASRRGTDASSPPVYGCRGSANSSRRPADSTTRPRVHDVHGVAQAGDHPEIVGDHHQGCVRVAHQLLEQLEDLGLDRHVERRGGLVGDQHARATGESHGDQGPLAHATGELVRVFLEPPVRVRDADPVQQVGSRGRAVFALEALVARRVPR